MQHPSIQSPPGSYWPKLVLATGIVIPVLLIFVTLPRPFGRNGHQPASTQDRMKQWGLVFKMYANGSEGSFWPPLARDGQLWAPDLARLFPEFLTPGNVDILVAREHPDRDAIRTTLDAVLAEPNPDYDTAAGLMGLSFAYVDVALQDLEDFRTLMDARPPGEGGGTAKTIAVSGSGTPLFRLRELPGCNFLGVWPANDPGFPYSQSSVPVLVEVARWRHKDPQENFPGAHVLYMDGHIELVPLGTYPVVPEVMDVLGELAPVK